MTNNLIKFQTPKKIKETGSKFKRKNDLSKFEMLQKTINPM